MKPLVLLLALACWPSSAHALDRQNVVASMAALRPEIRACYARYGVAGLVIVDVTIAPSGAVTRAALAHGSELGPGSPTGECVVRAVYAARVAPFDGAEQTIAYPFVVGK